MADTKTKTVSQLSSVGEDALGKASKNPAATVLQGANAAQGPGRRSLEARARPRGDGERRSTTSRSASTKLEKRAHAKPRRAAEAASTSRRYEA